MKNRLVFLAALAAVTVVPATAGADEVDEITMEVIGPDEAPEADRLMERIELPEEASDTARENAAFGLDTANRARERRREFGEETASAVREQREQINEYREQARSEAREQRREVRDQTDGGAYGRP